VVPVGPLDTSLAASATYTCKLTGFSQSLQRWSKFDATQQTPAFRLSPSPPDLTGNFNW
jgi:hypothetical protein